MATIVEGLEFRQLQKRAHDNSVEKGFWHEGPERNQAEMIALMHSELSEALEAIRKGNPQDSHCAPWGAVGIEMADTLIRIFDFCEGFGIDLYSHLLVKMEFNEGRPHMHGKKF